jgi:hypothetical protein
MMDGAHRFVEQQIEEAPARRKRFWKYDPASPATYEASIRENRQRLREIIGAEIAYDIDWDSFAEDAKAASWLDGKECIVLDYAKTSLVAKHIRDEIRLIAPNFYLGRVYWDSKPSLHFALQFS